MSGVSPATTWEQVACVWFWDHAGWVGANPVFWVGVNLVLVWLQGWVRPSFLFDWRIKWVGVVPSLVWFEDAGWTVNMLTFLVRLPHTH